jgi:transcription termination/antitermination protein NusG
MSNSTLAPAESQGIEEVAPVPTPENGQWYALHVLSGQEAKVKKNIDQRIRTEEIGDLIYEVVIPIERVSEVKKGKRVETERKLYPGYIFICMVLRGDDNKLVDRSWYFIQETAGVIGFADGDHPLPMPKDQIDAMLAQMHEREDKVSPKTAFLAGDKVKVGDGPFQNSEGVIEEIDADRGKLHVSISMFGRSTKVELEYWQVEKAA